MHAVPPVRRLSGGKPLIQPIRTHAWENKVTFNPACAYVSEPQELASIISNLPFGRDIKERLHREKGLCFLLYRAQGSETSAYDHRRSSMGLAVLSPELTVLARHTEPVILPDMEYDDLGVEDGRITKVGDKYVMVYTAYATGTSEHRIRIALASTRDFVHWEKHGLLNGTFNTIHNKNGMLFERPVGDRYILLHRPMVGPDAMAIHWATTSDVFGAWEERGVLMAPISNPAFADTWIGGGAPPLSLGEDTFLLLYHIGNRKATGEREYDIGIAVADCSAGCNIIRRNEPLLRPETAAETTPAGELGVANVLFLCGAYFYGENLYMPYAGADSFVLGGSISRRDLQNYLTA